MAINLANVNLTIQQFQAISSGKYNAGEVHLTSDHSLGKINNHVSQTDKNNESLSHAEQLAIKDAFVRALSQNGVAADEINRVRRELGLAPNGATDTRLAERSIRPLTRQQIREILDRNANVINAHAGAGTIRSHAEVHARFTPEQRAGFAQTRREVNEAMMRERQTLPDRGIAAAQAILAGDVRFRSPEERQRLIAAAELQKSTILGGSNGNPSDAPNATLKFTRGADGLAVTFSLGMSEKEYVRKLDDLLLILHQRTEPFGPLTPPPTLPSVEANANMLAVLTGQSTGRPTHETDMVKAGVRRAFEARFGAGVFNANATFSTFATAGIVTNALASIGDLAGARFTVEQVVAAIVEQAAPDVARLFLSKALAPKLQAAGGAAWLSAGLASDLFVRYPQLKDRLVAARTPAESRAALDEFRDGIASGVQRMVLATRMREQARVWYREKIAAELGVPVSALEGRGLLNLKRLDVKSEALCSEICSGRNAAGTDQQIEQSFHGLANVSANLRIGQLRQADALDVPAEARDILKEQILTLEKVNGINLADFKKMADSIPVDGLLDAIASEAPTDKIFAEMGKVGQLVENAAINILSDANAGADEVGAAANLLVTLALAKRPESFDLLRMFFARPDAAETSLVTLQGPASRAVAFQLFKPEIPAAESNAALADAIGTPGLASLHAQAICRALDDLGLGGLPANEKTKLISGDAGTAIARQVRAAKQPVTPSQLRALARMAFADEAVATHADSILQQLSQAEGCEVSPASAEIARGVLAKRDPGLLSKIKTAISRAAMLGEDPRAAAEMVLTTKYEDAVTVLRTFHEIEAVNATAVATAVREIAARANLTERFVSEKLDASGLLIGGGGSLNFLRADLRDQLSRPETDLAAWDVAAVGETARARVESFIAKKVAFIAEVDRMPLSAAARGSLIVDALSYPPYKDAELASAVVRILNRPEIIAALDYAKNILTKANVSQMEDEDIFHVFETVAAQLSAAIMAELPEAKRAAMDNDDHAVVRSLLGVAFVDHCGLSLMDAATELASGDRLKKVEDVGNNVRKRYDNDYMTYSTGVNDKGEHVPVDMARAAAANKSAANISFALRILSDVTTALDDVWLPADLAEAVHKTKATSEQTAFAAAIVRYMPKALERASAGLDMNAVARLGAFAVTLDWRGNPAASEAILREASEIIRTEVDEVRREERLAELVRGLFKTQDAAAFIAAAARTQGVQLDAAQTAKAVAFLAEFGNGMPVKNARILARFIASLELTDESADEDRQRLAFIAPEIGKWRDFGFADAGREEVSNFFKNECNALIREFEQPDKRASEFENDIAHTMIVDVPRGVYTIAGKRFNNVDSADVIAELGKLNLSPAAKRALSVLMCQSSAVHLMALQIHNEQPPNALRPQPLDPSTLPGAGAFVSRGQAPQLFVSPQIVRGILCIYDLSISGDGRTATLKLAKSGKINVGTDTERMNVAFGDLLVEEELTIDIASENPTVTNVRVSQTISDAGSLQERYLSETEPIPAAPPFPQVPPPPGDIPPPVL